tara:strand:+ start:103 stop:399 length:297 start_codon:yes stop_codon:yes gene_type:complete
MTTLQTLSIKYPNNDVIQYYMSETKEKWTKGKYYVGGQLPILPSDIITKQLIKAVDNINITKLHEVPYNSVEHHAIYDANEKFIKFKNLLKKENIIEE